MSQEEAKALETEVVEQPDLSVVNTEGSLEERLEELIEEEAVRSHISFGFVVLNSVVQGNYERAFSELKNVGKGLEEYSEFERDARRYVDHSKSLVSAIKTKRTICQTPQINRSKKRELNERIMSHFVELKKSIICIEKIEKRVKYEDFSTTMIFFKTVFYSFVAIFIGYVVIEVYPEIAVIPKSFFG